VAKAAPSSSISEPVLPILVVFSLLRRRMNETKHLLATTGLTCLPVTLAILLNQFPRGNYVNDVMIRQAFSGIGRSRLPGTCKFLPGIATPPTRGRLTGYNSISEPHDKLYSLDAYMVQCQGIAQSSLHAHCVVLCFVQLAGSLNQATGSGHESPAYPVTATSGCRRACHHGPWPAYALTSRRALGGSVSKLSKETG
jgi:hypothetical protein